MTERAAGALGANLGDRLATLREAVRRIGALGEIVAISRLYDTEPVGYADQPRYLNGALLLDTNLEPEALLDGLQAIEHGRAFEEVLATGFPHIPQRRLRAAARAWSSALGRLAGTRLAARSGLVHRCLSLTDSRVRA